MIASSWFPCPIGINLSRMHFINKPVPECTDDELLEALNKCYMGMECFPTNDGSGIGIEIRNCANIYDEVLHRRGRRIKLVFDDME